MTAEQRIELTAHFADEEELVRGIAALRRAGLTPHVFSPFPSAHVLAALELPKSRIGLWVLLGALTGALGGFAMTIGLSSAWYPHVTGGMPIVSLPPFVIIAFEMMILFGALGGAVAFFVHTRLPQLEAFAGYDPRFSEDRFGMVVHSPAGRAAEVERLLLGVGADEVERAEG